MVRSPFLLFIGLVIGGGAFAQEHVKLDDVHVRYSGIDQSYAEAIARTVSTARKISIEKFRFDMPDTIYIEVTADPSRKVRLFNDGQDRFSLTVRTEKDLLAPRKSGIFHIYGLCHEVGHLAMYRPIRDHSWMSYAAAEGWAHYLGSRLVDEIYEQLGRELWPDGYDYLADGTKRLQSQLASANASPTTKAAGQWQAMAKLVGDENVSEIFSSWGQLDVDSSDPGISLRTVFANMDKGEDLARWWSGIETDMVVKRPKSGILTETIAANQLDGEAVEVAHDDGQQAGKSSMAGGGHAVKFESGPGAPAYLTSIRLYGSRYGLPKAPKEDFHVWLCDEDFKQIAEFDFPYSKFVRGRPKWVTLKTKPTKVPDKFTICVGFNPTGTKGVYVGYDQEASGNSLIGLPGRNARAFSKGDWLIRATFERIKHESFQGEPVAETAKSEPRKWTDSTGNFTLVAEFVEMKDGQVQLRKASGEIITVPLARLSADDQEYLKNR